jgi:hypothetical protein
MVPTTSPAAWCHPDPDHHAMTRHGQVLPHAEVRALPAMMPLTPMTPRSEPTTILGPWPYQNPDQTRRLKATFQPTTTRSHRRCTRLTPGRNQKIRRSPRGARGFLLGGYRTPAGARYPSHLRALTSTCCSKADTMTIKAKAILLMFSAATFVACCWIRLRFGNSMHAPVIVYPFMAIWAASALSWPLFFIWTLRATIASLRRRSRTR